MTHRLEELKLAFAYHVAQDIVGADDQIDASEIAFLDKTFPRGLLRHVGFLDTDGAFTEAFDAARDEALERLPAELELDAKLSLVNIFVDACVVDGQLDRAESDALVRAATSLGLSSSQLEGLLDGHDAVGSLELDEPVDE